MQEGLAQVNQWRMLEASVIVAVNEVWWRLKDRNKHDIHFTQRFFCITIPEPALQTLTWTFHFSF